MNGTYNLADTAELVGRNFRGFVKKYDVAELNLLNHEVLDVVLLESGSQQIAAVAKLIAHAEGIDHRGYAIHHGQSVAHVFKAHRRNRADSLCYWCRLAYSAGLNNDVVEALLTGDVAQLLYEVHLKRAADATVLQGHEAVVLLSHYPALLYEVGIDIHLAYIVDYYGELNATAVV